MAKKDISPEKEENESVYRDFKDLRQKLDACARFVGLEVTIPTFEMSWRGYFIIFIAVSFAVGAVYTIYKGLIIDGEWMVLLQCTCQAGAGAQSIAKLIFYIKDRRFLWVILDIMDATYEHESRGDHYKKCLQEDFQRIKFWMKGFGVLYSIVVSLCILFPFFYYIQYKIKLMMMTFLVPGMNPETKFGFYLLTAFHTVCMVVGGVGNYAADMYLLFFISSAPVAKNILRCKLQDLDVKLEAFRSHNKVSSQEIRQDMVHIVSWHQKYLRVLECSERVFFVIIFVEISACCVSNLSILYCILRGDWPSGKVYIFYSISTFMMYCTLGTIVDNSNSDLTDIVYNFRWYDLPLSEQRTMLYMLRRTQATAGLSVGKMLPLNMQTALQLSKTTYTALMILLRGKETVD